MEFTNETTVERIMSYVKNDQFEQAETLAAIIDMLEECYTWDVSFE